MVWYAFASNEMSSCVCLCLWYGFRLPFVLRFHGERVQLYHGSGFVLRVGVVHRVPVDLSRGIERSQAGIGIFAMCKKNCSAPPVTPCVSTTTVRCTKSVSYAAVYDQYTQGLLSFCGLFACTSQIRVHTYADTHTHTHLPRTPSSPPTPPPRHLVP